MKPSVVIPPLLGLALVHAHAGAISENRDRPRAAFPSDLTACEMISRVTSEDTDEVMPAPKPGDPLTSREISPREHAKLSAELAASEQPLKFGGAEFDAEQRMWEADMARPIDWRPLTPADVKVEGGAKLRIEPDGTLIASGRAAYSDTFTITTRTALRGITALRIELLPDRAGSADAVINELQVTATLALDRHASIVLRNASTDIDAPDAEVGRIIDRKDDTRWRFPLPKTERHFLVVETIEPVAANDHAETELVFRITQHHGEHGTLSRFKLAAATSPHPVRELPAKLRAILALEPTERSDQQRRELADFFYRLSQSARKINDGGD
ncbi:MAG TPA: hypothetical protein VFV83_06700 [Chthoniobacteraceae bacterium]|nr:hypothetical protein [Chthoniobacteraceae bacterium]